MKKIKWVILILVVTAVGLQGFRFAFPEREKAARQRLYQWVKSAFPDAADQIQRTYGLKPFSGTDPKLSPGPVVILIHGLDEPGRVWMNLAPALARDGGAVWLMTYPNDQAIESSARFFFRTIKKQGFKKDISIVGHSMGGLVSRQMLTDPDIGYMTHAENGRVPKVRHLIMVGTPNHGSELARFRFFMEIRDQIQTLFSGHGHWMAGLLDGTGAAGIDLLPGSEFLVQLNARPHPRGVAMYVIAGILSPWHREDVASLGAGLRKRLPVSEHPGILSFESALNAMAAGLGDGLVSLDSARLEGIPLTRVPGTHLTMIRNLTPKSDRIPPAVPHIIRILTH